MTLRLKARVVKQEEASVARQQRGKYVSVTTNKRATIEELLQAVFSIQFMKRLYIARTQQ
jgi:hypothetical protein